MSSSQQDSFRQDKLSEINSESKQAQSQSQQDDRSPVVLPPRKESKLFTAIQFDQIVNALNTNKELKEKVLSAKFYAHKKEYQLALNSLFLFDSKSKIRIMCVWIVQSWVFDVFIILTILGNTILLMLQDYSSRLNGQDVSNSSDTEQNLELTTSIIFQIEFVVKIIAFGFVIGYKTYLRDPWNILDFIVVINSLFLYIPWVDSINWLRMLRILRPLRSINSVKGMKVLVKSLINAMPDLANVVFFMMFIIILFGILSLQLFSDAFEYRCRITETPIDGKWPPIEGWPRLCNQYSNNCPNGSFCGSYADFNLPQHPSEYKIPELNYGYTTFDNILTAFFSIFQSITLEGWSDIQHILIFSQDAWIVQFYFTSLIITGTKSEKEIREDSHRNLIINLLNNSSNILSQNNQTPKKFKLEEKKSSFKEQKGNSSFLDQSPQDINDNFIIDKKQQSFLSQNYNDGEQNSGMSLRQQMFYSQQNLKNILKKKTKYHNKSNDLIKDEIITENNNRRRSTKQNEGIQQIIHPKHFPFNSERFIQFPQQKGQKQKQFSLQMEKRFSEEIPAYFQFIQQMKIDTLEDQQDTQQKDFCMNNSNSFDRDSPNNLRNQNGYYLNYTQDLENFKFQNVVQDLEKNFDDNTLDDIKNGTQKQKIQAREICESIKMLEPNENQNFQIQNEPSENINIQTIQQNIRSLVRESISQINLDSEQEIKDPESKITTKIENLIKNKEQVNKNYNQQQTDNILVPKDQNNSLTDQYQSHQQLIQDKSVTKESQRLDNNYGHTDNTYAYMKTAETSATALNRITSQKSEEIFNKNFFQKNSFFLRKTTSQTYTNQLDDSPIYQQKNSESFQKIKIIPIQENQEQNNQNQAELHENLKESINDQRNMQQEDTCKQENKLKISHINSSHQEYEGSQNGLTMKQSTKSQLDNQIKQTSPFLPLSNEDIKKENSYSNKSILQKNGNTIEKNYNYFSATISTGVNKNQDNQNQLNYQNSGSLLDKKDYEIKNIIEEIDEINENENSSINHQPKITYLAPTKKMQNKLIVIEEDKLDKQFAKNIGYRQNSINQEGKNDDQIENQQQQVVNSPRVRFNDVIQINTPTPFKPRKKKPFKVLLKMIQNLVDSSVFFYFCLLTTLINTIILSMDRYPIDNQESQTLDIIGNICSYIFMYEMATKIIAFGLKEYLVDKFNLLDSLIVISSTIEIILQNTLNKSSGFSSFSVLRSLRLFRVVKLAKNFQNLKYLLIAIFNSLIQIKNFFILILLFHIVMGLLGMEFFAYFIRFDQDGNVASDPKLGQSPRMNFDNFINSIIMVFSLITNDSWNSYSYDLMRGMGSWFPGIYCIIIIIIGNIILLKLLLAILIFAFSEEAEQEKARQRELLEKKRNRRKDKRTTTQINEDQIKQAANKKSSFEQQQLDDSDKQIGQTLQIIEQNKNGEQNKSFSKLSVKKNSAEQVMNTSIQIIQDQNDQQQNKLNLSSLEKVMADIPTDEHQKYLNDQFLKKSISKLDSLQKTIQLKNIMRSVQSILPNAIQSTQKDGIKGQGQIEKDLNKSESQSPKLDSSKYDSMNENSFDNKFSLQKSFSLSSRQYSKMKTLRNEIQSTNVDNQKELQGKSIFLFSPENKLRQLLYKITKQRFFEIIIIVIIIISSVLLCLDDPFEDNNTNKYKILYILDIIITIFFVFESFILTISHGFLLNGKNSYLRNLSNVLDFFVIIISLINIFVSESSNQLKKFKVLRLLRVLRPLRLISKNEGISLCINSLMHSIPNIFNLIIINIFFYIIFGLYGVNNLKGKVFNIKCSLNQLKYFFPINQGQFYKCSIDQDLSQASLVSNDIDCMDLGGDWINQYPNFDNIGQAFISLYVVSLTEGWGTIMWMAVDSVDINKNSIYNYNKGWCFYFIFILFCCNFYLLSIFAGIVVDSFYTEKNKLGGYALLTNEQQQWVDLQLRIVYLKPVRHQKLDESKKYRKFIQTILENKYFEPFILVCIILNTLAFILNWNRQPDQMVQILKSLNYLFLTIFILEAILKIFCYNSGYFKESWNLFDFIVLVITLAGLILEQIQVFDKLNQTTSIIRTFKIARVVRMVKKAKSLRLIFTTFIISLPAFANIGGLLFIILFIYAVLGFNLFPYVKYAPNGLNETYNFQSFINSMFILFKYSTGESWNFGLINITQQTGPDNVCQDISSYQDYIQYGLNGCGNPFGYFYLASFQLIYGTILLNLFIAVILEGYDKVNQEEKSSLRSESVNIFLQRWKILDKNATLFIKASDIFQLLDKLEPPLGWKGLTISFKKKRNLVGHFMIPLYKHKKNKDLHFYFYDVLKSLSKLSIFAISGFVDVESNLNVKIIRDLQRIYKQKEKDAQKNHVPSQYDSSDLVAMLMISQAIRDFQSNKKKNGNYRRNILPNIITQQQQIIPQNNVEDLITEQNNNIPTLQTEHNDDSNFLIPSTHRNELIEQNNELPTLRNQFLEQIIQDNESKIVCEQVKQNQEQTKIWRNENKEQIENMNESQKQNIELDQQQVISSNQKIESNQITQNSQLSGKKQTPQCFEGIQFEDLEKENLKEIEENQQRKDSRKKIIQDLEIEELC